MRLRSMCGGGSRIPRCRHGGYEGVVGVAAVAARMFPGRQAFIPTAKAAPAFAGMIRSAQAVNSQLEAAMVTGCSIA
jgi:hypothetical protein